MEVLKYGRTDKGNKRLGYKLTIDSDYKCLIQSANRRGIKLSLTANECKEVRGLPCKLCGSTRNITVISIESGNVIDIDNVLPCCGNCRVAVNKLGYELLIDVVNKIGSHLGKSGSVVSSGGEYDANFAKYNKDKNVYDDTV